MYSVTGRIGQVKQPLGGFVPIRDFVSIQLISVHNKFGETKSYRVLHLLFFFNFLSLSNLPPSRTPLSNRPN